MRVAITDAQYRARSVPVSRISRPERCQRTKITPGAGKGETVCDWSSDMAYSERTRKQELIAAI